MNAVFTFLPFFILVLMIVWLVNKYLKENKLMVKVTHWLFLVYVTVLVAATCATSFFIGQKIIYKEWSPVAEIEDGRVEYYKKLEKGQIHQLDHLLKLSSFEYDEPTLTLNFSSMEHPHHVYIDKKASNDGNIEARVFAYGVYINGLDFSDQLQPPTFSLHENTLLMGRTLSEGSFPPDFSEMYDINVSIVKDEFTMTQFSEGLQFFNPIIHGDIVVYLTLPKDINIVNESELHLQFVEEK